MEAAGAGKIEGDAGRLFTPDEAAGRLRISDRQLRRLIQRGELRAVRFGKKTLIDPADLVAFIAAHKTAGNVAA
jgi:excisionase family DNA binding protein